ncbi:MAG TPA: hypothetical protein P5279_17265 [Anaerohalosphaeraceae bacterium]|jgi:hypothetical protein|nr:hypothetical protein [Anaerohalosphaeraceae bacterium]HRT52242.1 hypothetical protein [Anaerohalosphaeraceae bacterium]HRT88271.1 hypothetical protein [Anaerohalosphaeraceae bacterium]
MDKRLLTDELYQYLLRLRKILQQRGASALAEKVQFASDFALGSTSEYYTEAEGALKSVLVEHKGILHEQELCALREMLTKIDAAFKRIGGA